MNFIFISSHLLLLNSILKFLIWLHLDQPDTESECYEDLDAEKRGEKRIKDNRREMERV